MPDDSIASNGPNVNAFHTTPQYCRQIIRAHADFVKWQDNPGGLVVAKSMAHEAGHWAPVFLREARRHSVSMRAFRLWQEGIVEASRLDGGMEEMARQNFRELNDDLWPKVEAELERLREAAISEAMGQAADAAAGGTVQEGFTSKPFADYVATVAAGKSALVVSPTHVEGERITGHIRESLKDMGRVNTDEREISTLQKTNLTQAERGDAVNYAPGDVLVFQQNAKGYRKGERLVAGNSALPLDQASKFQKYRTRTIAIAEGDLLRVTQNGKTADGKHRLNNGAQYVVDGFTRQGDIRLNNGWTIDKNFGHLDYGYVVTSHASQGKTVDRVFIGQSSESFPASSREQFYVSVSRARQQATIYTDDKESLLDAVSRSDDHMTATEFLADHDHRVRVAHHQRIAAMAPERNERERTPTREGIEYDR